MRIGRRQFLKGVMFSGGLAVINPEELLRDFSDLPKPKDVVDILKDTNITIPSSVVAMGPGEVRIGSSLKHMSHTDAVLNGADLVGVANIKIHGSTSMISDSPINGFKYDFELECSFKEFPKLNRLHVGSFSRVETRFRYPGIGNAFMDIILPRAKMDRMNTTITSGRVDRIVFIKATPATKDVWAEHPYGKITWTS